MSDITISISMSLNLINQIENLAINNNSNFNDFIVQELTSIASNKSKNTNVKSKSSVDIINKYREY